MTNAATTQHVAALLASDTFVAAPIVARISALRMQAKSCMTSIAEQRKALDRVEAFLGENHPAVGTMKASLILLHMEVDALEAAIASML